jgi:hypothetical protein
MSQFHCVVPAIRSPSRQELYYDVGVPVFVWGQGECRVLLSMLQFHSMQSAQIRHQLLQLLRINSPADQILRANHVIKISQKMTTIIIKTPRLKPPTVVLGWR